MSPLPNPETVALHPVRVLVEKASNRSFVLKFNCLRRTDHAWNIDAYINLYLIARYLLHTHPPLHFIESYPKVPWCSSVQSSLPRIMYRFVVHLLVWKQM